MAGVYANCLKKRMFVQYNTILFILLTTVVASHGYTGEVIGVDSGDTLVADAQGEKHRIRLYGIDAPENGQHGSNAAQRFLRNLALAHPVEVEVLQTDVFGREVAVVRRMKKEPSINAAIVASGYAWVNPKLCQTAACDRWKGLQRQAKKYRLGIWAGFDLIPPWEFDAQQGR